MKLSVIFVLSILQLSLFILFFKIKRKNNYYFISGVFAFLLFHLLPLLIFQTVEADIFMMRDVGKIFLSGRDIYLSSSFPDYFPSYPRFTPYFPFWIYFIILADFLANKLSLSWATIVRMPGVLANLGIALLLLKRSSTFGISQVNKARFFALYLLNPIPTLIASYQGHWDTVVLFFLLLGLVEYLKRPTILSGFIFSLATLIKPWPIIFMPLLLLRIKGNLNRLKFIGVYSIPILLSIMIYSLFVSTSFIRIFKAVFFYQSLTGWWGISLLIFIVGKRLFPNWNLLIILNASKWLLGCLLIVVSFLREVSLPASDAGLFKVRGETPYRKPQETSIQSSRQKMAGLSGTGVKITQAMLLLILLVFVFTPGLSIHYLVWIVPLALLNHDLRHYFIYSILASIFLLFTFTFMVFPDNSPFIVSQYFRGLIINLLSLIVWGYFVYWLISLIRKYVYKQK